MSNAETKIKITVENQTAAGFNAAASSAADAGNRIKSTADKINSDIRAAMDRVGADVSAAMKQVDAELENVEAQAQETALSMGKIGTALAGIMSIGFAKYLAGTADRMQSLNSQVRQVTSSNAEFAAVQKELLNVANRTYASLDSTASLYVSTSRALKDYGYTQQEILQFTEATNNAMAVGGVEAQQQAAALMQLSQALGSGVLQGDEFKSISEAAPILLDTIAEYMGKSRAEIKKLGSEGELTADVIFKAISGASEKFSEQAAKMPVTLGQALTVFKNNWESMVSNLLNGSGIMERLARAVIFVSENLKEMLGAAVIIGAAAFVQAFGGMTIAVGGLGAAISSVWTLLLANPFVALAAAIVGVLAATGELGNALDALGTISSDLFGLISDGYSGLADLAYAIYADITNAGEESTENQTGAFNGFFDDVGSGFYGLLEGIGKVLDAIGILIRAVVVKGVEAFGDFWAAIKNGAVGAVNFAVSHIESLINAAIDGINRLIALANQVPGISIGTAGNVSLGRASGGNEPTNNARSFQDIYDDEAAKQGSGIRGYFKGLKDRAGGGSPSHSGGGSSGRKSGAGGGGSKGGGGSGRKSGGRRGGGGSAGRAEDPMNAWEAEIKAQKLAHNEMRIAEQSHAEWDLAHERDYWAKKLSLVDFNGKTGIKIREKIADLEKQLAKQTTEYKLLQVAEWEKADKFRLDMEVEAADQALAMGKMTQLQRLDAEIEFENQRYQIAFDALQERIALAQQDPTYSEASIAKLQQQAQELSQQHELKQAKNGGKREQQRRKDAPSMMEMLQDGGKNVWQSAQQNMSAAFSAMLNRTQTFGQAMQGFFKSTGQAFIQEMVTKPLAGLMQRLVQESAIYKMIYGTKDTMETAAAAKTVATKTSETSTVVGANAVQAASGAAASQSHIPIVGPMLAMAAMTAMMAAVNGLMGGGGSSTSTTTTRIPSAAGGWDIPAGINPLTQLHENEMVLPAEHAQTIRDMAGGGSNGGGDTVIINTTGGDFIHKKDLAKLLKKMNRDFKIV